MVVCNCAVMERPFSSDSTLGNHLSRTLGIIKITNTVNNSITDSETVNQTVDVSFGYKQLLDLSSKDGSEILLAFSQQKKRFDGTLTTSIKPDNIVLFMKCISKVCNVAFNESKTSILAKVCQSNLVSTLEQYFLTLPYAKANDKQYNKLFWNNCDDFWKNVFTFYNCVLALMPSLFLDTVPRLIDVNKMTLNGLEENQKVFCSKELLQILADVKMRLNVIKEELAAKLISRKAADEKVEVPDDFRTKTILPDVNELISRKMVFLRPNIIDGAYNSVDHYLDVQFRLMREDYISPMRDSIMSFIKDPTQRKYNGGRFYRSTKFKYFAVSNDRTGILVSFNEDNHVRNPKSFNKRFIFGSLLCFTKDKFKTCFFGTIVERSERLLSQGMVIVDLENVEVNDDLFKGTYLMFESDVFFLQYGPVLKVLQTIGDKLPMKNYIIDMQVSETVPSYVGREYVISAKDTRFTIDIKNATGWPSAEVLDLDEYQYKAYKMALSREFVTIQGPPGTGKTFIGLKIVNTLLNNISKHDKPLLVLCFTNHALDQFLSGILPTTNKIVRIGGQSKNEEFAKKYNLHSLRKSHAIKNPYSSDLFNIIEKMKMLQSAILHIEAEDGIIDMELLSEHLPQYNINTYLSSLQNISSKSGLVSWLLMMDKPQEIFKYRTENVFKCYQDIISVPKNAKEDLDFDDIRYMMDEDVDVEISEYPITYEKFSLHSLAKKIEKIDSDLNKGDVKVETEVKKQLKSKRLYYLCQLFHLKNQLSNVKKEKVDFSHQLSTNLNLNQRWKLYRYWCAELKTIFFNLTTKLKEKYDTLYKLYEDFNMMSDIQILKTAHVVGLTTTAAARLRPLLCSLSPSIVVVEEAAEVLESHIIVNLNENCKHVIMLGDHQQLRPTTASYRLGRKFNLEISLFERTFKNGKNFCQLGVQHRMRPEIANLITPSIYPVLENHPSVLDYPSVKGVAKNLFFISHNIPEEKDDDLSSHSNKHEAHFIISLAKYLIQQGYEASDITILSTYSGQMFYIRDLKKSIDLLKDVRIYILDNYQGEENKIILLSLVRSNSENNVGFLNIANRVCVALSRAKEGFFLMGNINNLINASGLWKKIYNTLIEQSSIGPSIPLQCQNHNVITEVASHTDFYKVVEGGCQNQCNVLLKCGHICLRLCHIDVTKHDEYKCREKCQRECFLGHKCNLLCCEPCECVELVEKRFRCGHINKIMCCVEPDDIECFVEILHTLPQCSHQVTVFCCVSRTYVECPAQCIDRLPCGHACTRLCHKDNDPEHLEYECKAVCGRRNKGCTEDHRCQKLCFQECDSCTIWVHKTRKDCSHSIKIACHKDPNLLPCNKDCTREMSCGHICKRKCVEPCTGCQVKVKKERSCGHNHFIECGRDVENVVCSERCNQKLKCGHLCRNKCFEQCGGKPCIEKIPNPYKSLCGHDFQIRCKDSDLGPTGNILTMEYCTEPCGMVLKDCEHICQGTCGKCRGRLHPPCSQPCGNRLICGHICDDPCREDCSMCRKPCMVKCSHSKCPLTCGVPCKPCKHKCDRRCIHSKCTKECSEICDRIPCSESCPIDLKCGHGCLGLCGELCPDICKVCNPENMPEIFFGNEEDEDARFVKLIDCLHIVEVNGMDFWIKSLENGEIAYPRCPYCNTPVMNTPRYYKAIKTIFNDVQNAKKKIYGDPKELKSFIAKLNLELDKLSRKEVNELFKKVPEWKAVVVKIEKDPLVVNINKDIRDSKKWKKKTIQLSKPDIENSIFQTTILNRLAETFLKEKYPIESNHIVNQVKFILRVLFDCQRKITQQQINDFNCELTRTWYLIRFDITEKQINSLNCIDSDRNTLSNIETLLFSNKSFNAAIEETVRASFRLFTFKVNITDAERFMIVKAVGLKQGHWFKCPNGHPYCIGECGGAMQKSICPECGCAIGGTSHTLLSDNILAPEMDNASHAAYSDFANEQMLLNRRYNV
ncbi:NFX1-type zinc finger-containing protein 1-like [Arctopsyche grandis]|uniref:NFX1-type zinc finger-containing protein 1-like n=1 Tax=Arctopsyche grandis TaxID=121162 RepID=UPI00406D7F55